MKVTKEMLIKKNSELQIELDRVRYLDHQVREYLSGFLGFREERWGNSGSVKVQQWPDLYFALGRIMAEREDDGEMRRLRKNDESLQLQIVGIQEKLERRDKDNGNKGV